MRPKVGRLAVISALPAAAAILLAPAAVAAFAVTPSGSDEFSGIRGSAPNAAIWGHQVGGGGWGNQELQVYTDSTQNASLDGQGRLAITALRSGSGYTSARLNTKGKFEFTYGRVEASIKMPAGRGLNSAFWTLGSNIDSAGYPGCGEIDMAEYLGYGSSYHVGLHGPLQANPSTQWQRGADPTTSSTLSAGFHTYWVEKEPDRITVGIDKMTVGTVARSDLAPGEQWVFNAPSNVLLDVAVGGNFAGPVPASTKFPATMLVDYVRYYDYVAPGQTKAALPKTSPAAATPIAQPIDPAAAFAASLATAYQQTMYTFGTALSNMVAALTGQAVTSTGPVTTAEATPASVSKPVVATSAPAAAPTPVVKSVAKATASVTSGPESSTPATPEPVTGVRSHESTKPTTAASTSRPTSKAKAKAIGSGDNDVPAKSPGVATADTTDVATSAGVASTSSGQSTARSRPSSSTSSGPSTSKGGSTASGGSPTSSGSSTTSGPSTSKAGSAPDRSPSSSAAQ